LPLIREKEALGKPLKPLLIAWPRARARNKKWNVATIFFLLPSLKPVNDHCFRAAGLTERQWGRKKKKPFFYFFFFFFLAVKAKVKMVRV
jgi:hypothetical protein